MLERMILNLQTLSSLPSRLWIQLGLARTHEELGEFAEATRAYNTVLRIWSAADPGIRELDFARTRIAQLN